MFGFGKKKSATKSYGSTVAASDDGMFTGYVPDAQVPESPETTSDIRDDFVSPGIGEEVTESNVFDSPSIEEEEQGRAEVTGSDVNEDDLGPDFGNDAADYAEDGETDDVEGISAFAEIIDGDETHIDDVNDDLHGLVADRDPDDVDESDDLDGEGESDESDETDDPDYEQDESNESDETGDPDYEDDESDTSVFESGGMTQRLDPAMLARWSGSASQDDEDAAQGEDDTADDLQEGSEVPEASEDVTEEAVEERPAVPELEGSTSLIGGIVVIHGNDPKELEIITEGSTVTLIDVSDGYGSRYADEEWVDAGFKSPSGEVTARYTLSDIPALFADEDDKPDYILVSGFDTLARKIIDSAGAGSVEVGLFEEIVGRYFGGVPEGSELILSVRDPEIDPDIEEIIERLA